MRILLLLAVLTVQVALGQRPFKTVDPSDLQEDLSFDVNTVAVDELTVELNSTAASSDSRKVIDLNFSPNVIFSQDSKRAFVSYSGSDVILVFNPKTGEAIQLVKVDPNPGVLTLTPDGTQIALVSHFLKENLPDSSGEGAFIGSLSLLDVESLQVRTLALEKVFFSFANNIVFSEDGKTGFVASLLTDELIRFDTETLTEEGQRLKFVAGTRPASLRFTPDFATLTAVLVGSSNLDRRTVPDSIALIDPVSFDLRKTVAPELGDDNVPHDFTAVNTIAFSDDGKYGIIADQQFAELSQIPELTADRSYILDLEQEEFIGMVPVGGVAAGAFYAPTGEFVVLSALQISFVNPVTLEARSVLPVRSDYRPRNNVVFMPDQRRMILASPLRDSLLVIDIETLEVKRGIDIGGEVKRTIVDQGNEINQVFTSAPLQIALSPDDEVLAIVNFNANTIELAKDSQQFFVPKILATDELFTGMALTNVSDQPVDLVITGYRQNGILFTDLIDTEDLVEYLNPITKTLLPGTQLAASPREFLDAQIREEMAGWFDFDTQQPIASFFLTGDFALRRLDGAVTVSKTHRRVIAPEVQVLDGRSTQLTILNPNLNSTSVDISLIDQEGTVLNTFSRVVGVKSMFTGPIRDQDPDDGIETGIFAESNFENFEKGYVLITTDEGVIVYERYFDDERMSALLGLPAENPEEGPVQFYVPQIALQGGSDAIINVINSNPVGTEEEPGPELSIELTFRDGSGQLIVPPKSIQLAAGLIFRQSLVSFFELTDEGPVLEGWLSVAADQPGLLGDVEFQLGSKAMSTVPLQSVPDTELVFAHLAQGLGFATGLAFANVGTGPATITISVFDADGILRGQADLNLPVSSRSVGLLDEYVPELGEQIGGYIRVNSDQPLIGLELFFKNDLGYVSAVLPQ